MSVYVQDTDFTLHHGDALEVLRSMEPASVHCCVTSPPYWGLRDYGSPGQIGLEPTPDEYVARLVAVFAEVRRVLRDDGTLWLNLGDSYASGETGRVDVGHASTSPDSWDWRMEQQERKDRRITQATGIPAKNLVGIPWRVAFALQADGWWLRSDIIWSKPNPMPESVTDRPTKSHEYLFLLSKSARYFFDQEAVREQQTTPYDAMRPVYGPGGGWISGPQAARRNGGANVEGNPAGRNVRSVWEIATQPYAEAHFATFPQELPRRCIAAGSPVGGTILDPFGGSGTTALVARNLRRNSILIELNADYCALAAKRLSQQSLLAGDAA